MIEYAIGAVAGAVGGAAVGSMLSGAKKSELERLQRENNRASDESEKLRLRLKEAERQVEDLLVANKRLRNQAKDMEDEGNDVEDELYSAKAKVKSLSKQNEDLKRQLEEYKQLCASQELQIKELKNR